MRPAVILASPSRIVPSAAATAIPSPTDTLAPTPTDILIPDTPTATFDPAQATLEVGMGSMHYLSTIPQQYLFNLVGTPLKGWHDIPIMPQATAGQEFNPKVYSYKAVATIDQVHQFYAGNTKFPGIFKHTAAGIGINTHYIYLEFYDLTIYLLSHDKDPVHVIVAISRFLY